MPHSFNQHLHISNDGLDLVRHFEGLYLKAYKCPAGVWTIGYGHTGLQHKDGTVYPGRVITEIEAIKLLDYDLDQYEARVKALVNVRLTQAQFDALVSFDFNCDGLTIGPRNASPSTLLKALNRGDFAAAALEFPKWVNAKGHKDPPPGLVRRRKAERAMFEGGNWRQFII